MQMRGPSKQPASSVLLLSVGEHQMNCKSEALKYRSFYEFPSRHSHAFIAEPNRLSLGQTSDLGFLRLLQQRARVADFKLARAFNVQRFHHAIDDQHRIAV